MSSCTGNGECLEQCVCICIEDDETETPSEVCTCGHRNHTQLVGGTTECDMYCEVGCPHNCKLVECHNYRVCGRKGPQWYINSHNGMCSDCAIMLGRIKFLDTKDDCPVCMENKDMIQISCEKHTLCLDCWKQMSETENRPIPLTCPLCRESIWNWRKK